MGFTPTLGELFVCRQAKLNSHQKGFLMSRRHNKLSESEREFQIRKNVLKLWVWEYMANNREDFMLDQFPNRGFTDDDGATLIGCIVNVLFADIQAFESKKYAAAVRDFSKAYFVMATDVAAEILEDNALVREAVLKVLLRQYDVRTMQDQSSYDHSKEGQKVIEILSRFNDDELPIVTEESFNKFAHSLAQINTKKIPAP